MTTDVTRIEQEIRIDASPETVFSYLTDPAKMAMWWGQHIAIDASPGGAYRIVIRDDVVMRGECVEVDPPNRLVMTWGWEGSDDNPVEPGSTTLSYDLTPAGEGTILKLTHTGLPDAMLQSHSDGWTHYMARLSIAAAGGDPGPDPNAEAPDA